MLTHDSDSSANEATMRRGIAAARAGLRSVAAAQFERAAENAPDDPNVWLWLAWVANSPDNTTRCLERVLEISPGHAAATAGLTWACSLSQDRPLVPIAPPQSLAPPTATNVLESLNPAISLAECCPTPLVPVDSQDDTIRPSQKILSLELPKSIAVNGWNFGASNSDLQHEPVTPVFVSETPADTVRVEVPDPQIESIAENPAVESAALPDEPVPLANTKPVDASQPSDETRRRWTDLVQRESESALAADAWPSLVPPPLPTFFQRPTTSVVPPPLPSSALSAPDEPEPISRSRFHTRFTASTKESAELPPVLSLDSESSSDVEALATSFHPATVLTSGDDRPLVMIVDDSPTVRKLVALTLERRGYRVISAFDGVAAIKELGTCRPDLILLDINMPRLDGYRLCKLIKKHEATQAIPVVMLSGKDGMFDKLRGRLVGCSDYITKPFEADALTHKVAKYLTPSTSSL